MKLSIGMIVKNEEKYLRDCLEAISSLRSNVECELIIADTGSTDRTKEIASEYADILFDFEWCDDFSAARNSTVDRASGEWYMFLDADEIFEDTTEIEEFFNGGEYKEYHCGSFKVHSYLDPQKTDFLDFQCLRLFDRSMPDARFVNRIHEAIPGHEPTKFFTAFVHHWGYVVDGVTDIQKSERNLKFLMSELEKDPEDVRTLSHLVREFSPDSDSDKVIEYANRGLRALKKRYQRMIAQNTLPKNARVADASYGFFALYHQKVLSLYNQKKWESLIETTDQYFKGKYGDFRSDVDIYWFRGHANYKLGQYSECVKAFEQYIRLYKQCVQGGLKTDDMMFSYVNCDREGEYQEALLEASSGCIQEEKYNEAFTYLEQLPAGKIQQLQPAFLCMEKSEAFDYLLTLWKKQEELNDPVRMEQFIYNIEKYRQSYPDELRQKMTEVIVQYNGEDTYHYILLNQMRRASYYGNTNDIESCLDELLRIRPFTRLLADTIYYTIKYSRDISCLFKVITVDDLKFYLADIKSYHGDYAETVAEYFESHCYEDTMLGVYWTVLLQETAILTDNLYDEDVLPLMNRYLSALRTYTYHLYHPDLYKEETLDILPGPARFAYYTEQARLAEEKGDEIGYYRGMNKAVDSYKVMAKYIKLVTNEHQKQENQQRESADLNRQELKELAEQIKKQIFIFYQRGEYASAEEVLKEYDAIIPGDTDLDFVRERIVMGDFVVSPKVPS